MILVLCTFLVGFFLGAAVCAFFVGTRQSERKYMDLHED